MSLNCPSLVNVLNSFRLENGEPDFVKRKLELDDLISSLLLDESRYLKQCIEKVTFVRDFIPELPVEIRICITDYLEISDLSAFLDVSHRWYKAWTQIAICNKLMKQHFRSAFENHYQKLPNELRTVDFVASLVRVHHMLTGTYHSMKTLRYYQDTNDIDEPVKSADRRYCNRRVAVSSGDRVRVLHLSTGAGVEYVMPDRTAFERWELSETHLVALCGNRMKIHAWSLDTGNLQTVHVTTPIHSMNTQGHRVGVITGLQQDVLIWTIGDKLRQANILDPFPNHEGNQNRMVLFHPTSENKFFVIHLASLESCILHWVVQKYDFQNLTRTFEFHSTSQDFSLSSGNLISAVRMTLQAQLVDEHGQYIVCIQGSDDSSDIRSPRRSEMLNWQTFIAFNVYDEEFQLAFRYLQTCGEVSQMPPRFAILEFKKDLHVDSTIEGGHLRYLPIRLIEAEVILDASFVVLFRAHDYVVCSYYKGMEIFDKDECIK